MTLQKKTLIAVSLKLCIKMAVVNRCKNLLLLYGTKLRDREVEIYFLNWAIWVTL